MRLKKYPFTLIGLLGVAALFLLSLCWLSPAVVAQEEAAKAEAETEEITNEDCQLCHGEEDATGEREDGTTYTVYVPNDAFTSSVHGELDCVNCHADLDGAELPHEDPIDPVDCGACHTDEADIFAESLHGQAVEKKDPLAPRCKDCHGNHSVLAHANPKSPTFMLNVPRLCGRCHSEGSEVQKSRDIPQDHILENYSLSIHGKGLYKKGLTVTAVCNSCHTSHHVLPHTDPRSSISKENVSRTCMKCHAQIEQVHRKVIEGKLWEAEPHKIPVCVDCHEPHKARKVFYDEGMSDADCLACHDDEELVIVRDGERVSLHTDETQLAGSAHANVRCSQCHPGGNPAAERACETVPKKVDCAICHTEQVENYQAGIHGQLAAKNDPNAPGCRDCHGTHGIKKRQNPESPTFPKNVVKLCGNCHRAGAPAAVRRTKGESEISQHYAMSIHGKGLLESGLLVTATCVSCHTAHRELPRDDPNSTIHRDNIPQTCGNCHEGILSKFKKSVHAVEIAGPGKNLPQCADCHSAHTISRTDQGDFRQLIMDQCGRCHEEISRTYFDTYHGKASHLGYGRTAKCHDCHGAHDILPPDSPASHLSRDNIVETCGKCHPGSHRRFAGYLTHATHHDREKYPLLYYSFWGMTLLLVSTLVFFGLHTLAWLPMSIKTLREKRRKAQSETSSDALGLKLYRRFPPLYSKLHIVVIFSFFGLAITGMALKFSYAAWASLIAHILGGVDSMRFIHRVCAIATFGYAGVHLWSLNKMRREQGKTWIQFIWAPDSMGVSWRDAVELWQTLKWFAGRGPRPHYGRWTYWEKFDYYAVFWGVVIIGSSGLVLWFPEFFTLFLPAKLIKIAEIIHSDEALLAVGFIFTIHFFNTHFRPDKFPIDTVMFTGRMTVEELKHDKPREYEQFKAAGFPEDRLAPPMPDWYVRWAKVFGFTALTIGISLIGLIVYAMLFEYQ